MVRTTKLIRTLLGTKAALTEKPHQALFRSTALITIAPVTMLCILVFQGELGFMPALYGGTFVFILSIIFVRPYVANLAALTRYVQKLANNKTATPPDLTFLNNVEELTEAVAALHATWQHKREQLELLLLESRVLIDSLPDCIILFDQQYQVIRMNKTADILFAGHSQKEVETLLAEHPQIHQAIEHAMAQQEPIEFFCRLELPSTRHYSIRIDHLPRMLPSQKQMIMVMHDITEMKKTEILLSDFVANASHEIRTPLASIAGLVETLQTTAKDDEEARERFLKVMERQAERMTKLVSGLLSISKIEKHAHIRPTEQVDIIPLLEELHADIVWEARKRDMDVDLEIIEPLPLIKADATEIVQLFENLISNAIKYGNKETCIHVKAQEVPNHLLDRVVAGYKTLLMVAVKDEGEGIAPEDIERLTERFFRVDRARSRQIGGSGLGLSIVKYIVEHHGAVLTIESEVGKGSRFTVYFPIETP